MTEQSNQLTAARKWLILVILTTGVFMTMLDSTIVNVVLNKMMAELNADVYSVEWVILAFMLGVTTAMSFMGWLGGVVEIKNIFLMGLALFTVMSALCGFAPNLNFMELTRFAQGFGSGLVITTGMTLLYATFPKNQQGMAMGFFAFGASVAPAIGPTLGGVLTDTISWRWIFYVNVPVGLAAVIAGILFLHRTPDAFRPKRVPLDLIGFILMAVSLGALNIFLSKGQEYNWLESDFILGCFLVFLVTFIPFVVVQLTKKNPLISVRLLRHPIFSLCVVIMGLYAVMRFGVWVLVPLYMENIRQYPTITIGIVLLPGSIFGAIGTLAAGVLADKWRAKWVLVIGLVGGVWACMSFHTQPETSKWLIAYDYGKWILFTSIVFSPLLKIALSRLEQHETNMGATILNVTRLIFGSAGSAIAVALAAEKTDAIYTSLAARLNYGETWMRQFIASRIDAYGIEWLGQPFHEWKAQMQMFIESTAMSYAYQDILFFLGLISISTVVVALFLKKKRRSE